MCRRPALDTETQKTTSVDSKRPLRGESEADDGVLNSLFGNERPKNPKLPLERGYQLGLGNHQQIPFVARSVVGQRVLKTTQHAAHRFPRQRLGLCKGNPRGNNPFEVFFFETCPYCEGTNSCTILKPREASVCGYLQGNHQKPGFLSGAKWILSTVWSG